MHILKLKSIILLFLPNVAFLYPIMDINIDIFGSKEVDYNPTTTKRKRKVNDEYDHEDSLFENQDYENEPVELEPELKNFFVYKGTLPDEPKKVLQQYRLYKNDRQIVKKKNFEENTKNDPEEDTAKIKYTFADEYRIKNEIMMRNLTTFDNYSVFEFFVNHLIYDETTTTNTVYKKLNISGVRILSNDFLVDRLDEIKVKFDIEVIKLVEMINAGVTNDSFYALLLDFYDLYIKKYYLDIFITGKKTMVEKTIKKHIKAFVDDKIGEKHDLYKNWSKKMHAYKKRVFYHPNKHLLNSSLVKSEMLESKE